MGRSTVAETPGPPRRGCSVSTMTVISDRLNPAGPAQTELLIHFCGRPPGLPATHALPSAFRQLTPAQRLDSILWQEQIWGFPPLGSARPVVSLSESPLDHLVWLLGDLGWPPWGLLLWRQKVYDAGGAPVWYARSDQYGHLTDEQRSWAVRFDASSFQRSDWLHEREWRIPVPPTAPAVRLSSGLVFAALVGDHTWQPSARQVTRPSGRYFDSLTGMEVDPASTVNAYPLYETVMDQPPLWGSILHLYWDSSLRKLSPLP
jgi:hypothetical protein